MTIPSKNRNMSSVVLKQSLFASNCFAGSAKSRRHSCRKLFVCVVTCLDDVSGAVCCLISSRRVDCCLISSRRADEAFSSRRVDCCLITSRRVDEAGRLSLVPSDISQTSLKPLSSD